MTNQLSGEAIYRRYAWRYDKSDFKFCPRCGGTLILQPLHIPDEEQLVCHHCQFILYLDPKLVVTGIVQNGGDVLLLRRAEAPQVGRWGLPGGHVERGQDPRAALRQEVQQEAGLAIIIERLLDVYSEPSQGLVQLVFTASAISRNLLVNVESFEARFFSSADIPWNELAFAETVGALRMAGIAANATDP